MSDEFSADINDLLKLFFSHKVRYLQVVTFTTEGKKLLATAAMHKDFFTITEVRDVSGQLITYITITDLMYSYKNL